MSAARGRTASRRRASTATTSSCAWPGTGSSASGRCRAGSRRSSCSTTGLRSRGARARGGGARRAREPLRRESRAGHRSRPRALGRASPLGDARRGLARRRAWRSRPGARRRRALGRGRSGRRRRRRRGRPQADVSCSPGFDEYMLGYKDRDPILAPEHAAQGRARAPTAIFRPIIVDRRSASSAPGRGRPRPERLTITLRPFAGRARSSRSRSGPRSTATATSSDCPRRCEPVVAVRAAEASRCRPRSCSSRATCACTTTRRSRRRSRRPTQVVPLFVLDDVRARRISARPTAWRSCSTALARSRRVAARRAAARSSCARATVVEETLRVAHEARRRRDLPERGRERLRAGARAPPAARRATRRASSCTSLPGVTASRPATSLPDGADCYRVFTPYWRRWHDAPRRAARADAARDRRARPARAREAPGARGPRGRPGRRPTSPRGGESEGRKRFTRWLARRARGATTSCTTTSPPTAPRGSARTSTSAASRRSRLCERARGREGAEPFVRQLCWRDFYAQLLAARPEIGARGLPAARPPLARGRRRTRGLAGGPHRLSRSSTRACGSSRARASCTTARGCSRRRS